MAKGLPPSGQCNSPPALRSHAPTYYQCVALAEGAEQLVFSPIADLRISSGQAEGKPHGEGVSGCRGHTLSGRADPHAYRSPSGSSPDVALLWLDTLQGHRSSHRHPRLCADRDRQHRRRSRLSLARPSWRCSQSDAVCGGRKHRRRALCPRCHVARKLQPERHCLGAPPSTIRHAVLVAGVSQPGLVPVLGQVRSRFLARNHRDFRLARLRVAARVPSLDFHHSQEGIGARARSPAIGPSPSAIAMR